jgi:thymidylate synthase ThyX
MIEKIKQEIKKICEEKKYNETKFLDLKDLKVELIDCSNNPYKVMCNMALCTWGSYNNKWKFLSPESRFYVVKEVLDRKALPLALESSSFSFSIENCSRAVFDQLARARIGVVFSSKGQKDNFLNDLNFIIPSRIKDTILEDNYKEICFDSKNLYTQIQNYHIPNWAARCVINMYASHRFIMCINFKSLQDMCSSRMQTTEIEDCVAIAYLLRNEVSKKFPLLANYLRPMCDWIKKDTNYNVNGFWEILGIPHISDMRWSSKEDIKIQKNIAKFYEPCTNLDYVERKLNIKIPSPNDWKDYTWETLDNIDKENFMKD